jgi:hypothetical protein
MKLRTMAVLGGLGIAAMALIGAGAAAQWTTSTTSTQTITAGTLSLVLTATNPDSSPVVGNGTPNITLAPTGPTGSTFSTPSTVITITNNGTINATEITVALGDTHGTAPSSIALENETWVCLWSAQANELLVNEPLTTVEGYGAVGVGATVLTPGETDSYVVVYYAGSSGSNAEAACGGAFSGYSGGNYTSAETYTPPAPTFGVNTGAAALGTDAMGGVLTPTFTVNYSE